MSMEATKPRRRILDSTLRDGGQMPGICFTGEQALKAAALLDDGGVYQIEAGAPATSRQEKENIARIVENRKNALISVWARMSATDIEHAADCGPDLIHISVPVSYPHIYAKLGKNEDWVMGQLRSCLELAEKYGIPLSVGFEDAFRGEPPFMQAVAGMLLDFGVRRIRLSDTVGVATPSVVGNLVRFGLSKFRREGQATNLGDNPDLGFHAHNDLGMAVANTVEAAKCGCLYADVTAGGIGERAGNCDLARLVAASADVFDWGISPEAAFELQKDILKALGL